MNELKLLRKFKKKKKKGIFFSPFTQVDVVALNMKIKNPDIKRKYKA